MNFLKKIKDAKVPLSRIPRKVYSHNLPFTQELDVLGFKVNSANMTVSLRKEKKSNLLAS